MSSVGHTGANASDDKLLLTVDKIGGGHLTVIFAGYHTPKPKNGLGDYRTIGRVGLHMDRFIADASTNVGQSADDDK